MSKGKENRTSDQAAPSCDWGSKAAEGKGKGSPGGKPAARQRTRLHRFDSKSYHWSGVKEEAYKKPDGSWADVVRHTLIGGRGENTDFHLRYFEVAPGGMTSLERHTHEHVVVGVRGRGVCHVRKKDYAIGLLDVIYIPPGAEHQLRNEGKRPFGFFCIVDAERDRPMPVEDM